MSPICATFLAHLILDLIILTLFGEEYSIWSSPLYNFLRPPVTHDSLRSK